ncbi:MAG: hypothetical protein ACK5MK_09285 [Dysgonomonas sp.]
MKIKTDDILFATAILFAVWFAATGWVWVYYANIIYALPFGIASLLIWLKLKKDGNKRNKTIPIILIVGLFFSLGWLLYIFLIKR